MTTEPTQGSTAEDELDALLDDALNDFVSDQGPESSGAAFSSSAQRVESVKANKGKGLAFDPLPKPKSKRSHTAAASSSAAPFGGFGAIPPDIADQDDISAGFSKMMAELAQVDLTQGQAPLPSGEPPVPGNHDLAATLKALAANSHSFGGSSAAQSANLSLDGIDPEMITRLSQQLAALTEDAERIPANQQGAGEDMSGLVDGIMHQLLAKDVLYQPIQEIGSRYPQWLQDHRQRLSPEDLQRYSQQFQHIQEITRLYEQEPDNFPKLINLLQQMQACGEPPKEIVDEMAPALALDANGQPQLPSGLSSVLGGLPGLSGGASGPGNCCIQ
ncbi:Natural resistance-associated macrophage protein [Trebouxia sp. C0010 RCD-2024]